MERETSQSGHFSIISSRGLQIRGAYTPTNQQGVSHPGNRFAHVNGVMAYGLYPQMILPLLFDFKVEATNLANIFRARPVGLFQSEFPEIDTARH